MQISLFLLLTLLSADPGVFPIADSGALPGTNATASIQAAVDAAQAYTAADPTRRSAVVTVPLGEFFVGRPVSIDGQRVTVKGLGAGSRLNAPYGGPVFALGMPRLSAAEIPLHRVPTWLDSSAATGRTALSTNGTHALIVGQCSLGLGGKPPSARAVTCDWWQGSRYTIEFAIAKPPGATYLSSTGLLGASLDGSHGDPILIQKINGGFSAQITYADGRTGTLSILTPGLTPLAADNGPWAFCLQTDTASGKGVAWINNRACQVQGDPIKPGVPWRQPSGSAPWQLGSIVGTVPSSAGQVAPLYLGGYQVTAGWKYDASKPTQVRIDGTVVNDSTRYFQAIQTPTVQTVAFLPLDDPADTYVGVRTSWGNPLGYWKTSQTQQLSTDLALEDMTVVATEQAPVQVGSVWGPRGVRFSGVEASGSLVGIGSLGFGTTYMVELDRCVLGGSDSAYDGFHQLIWAHNNVFSWSGRHGVRLFGGNLKLHDSFFSFGSMEIHSYVQVLTGAEYGSVVDIRGMLVDDETWAPTEAILHVQQAEACPVGRVVVDGLDCAMNGSKGTVWLEGFGTDEKEGWTPNKVTISHLGPVAFPSGPALRVDGPVGAWFGTADLSEQQMANPAVGTGLPSIKVTLPAAGEKNN